MHVRVRGWRPLVTVKDVQGLISAHVRVRAAEQGAAPAGGSKKSEMCLYSRIYDISAECRLCRKERKRLKSLWMRGMDARS